MPKKDKIDWDMFRRAADELHNKVWTAAEEDKWIADQNKIIAKTEKESKQQEEEDTRMSYKKFHEPFTL